MSGCFFLNTVYYFRCRWPWPGPNLWHDWEWWSPRHLVANGSYQDHSEEGNSRCWNVNNKYKRLYLDGVEAGSAVSSGHHSGLPVKACTGKNMLLHKGNMLKNLIVEWLVISWLFYVFFLSLFIKRPSYVCRDVLTVVSSRESALASSICTWFRHKHACWSGLYDEIHNIWNTFWLWEKLWLVSSEVRRHLTCFEFPAISFREFFGSWPVITENQ